MKRENLNKYYIALKCFQYGWALLSPNYTNGESQLYKNADLAGYKYKITNHTNIFNRNFETKYDYTVCLNKIEKQT